MAQRIPMALETAESALMAHAPSIGHEEEKPVFVIFLSI